MQSLAILRHALRMVFGNFADALKVSLVLTLAGFALLSLAAPAPQPGLESAPVMGPGELGMFLVGLMVNFVLGAWVAVAWHRFVLLQEYPASFLPSWRGPEVMTYIGRLLLVGAVLVAVGVAALLVLAIFPFTAILGPGAVLATGAITGFLLAVVSFRISLILPAAALGREMSLGESWRQTAPLALDIAGLAAIVMVFALFFGVLSLPGPIGLVVSFVVNWIGVMVSASLLTTLYGMTVEGRELT